MKRVLATNLSVMLGLASVCVADIKPEPKQAKVVVAVIDTGIDPTLMSKPWICKEGHKDFTGSGLVDNHGHGTHIAGIVEQHAKKVILDFKKNNLKSLDDATADFCIIAIKYFDPKVKSDNLDLTIKSLRWAIDQKVDIINYSGGGTEYSEKEFKLIEEALKKGIKVVAAAGNERSNLETAKYYPAMYDQRIFIVGNLQSNYDKTRAPTSNYGKPVNTWEVGTNVISRLPGGTIGFMTGTSQATAVKSGKIVREMLDSK